MKLRSIYIFLVLLLFGMAAESRATVVTYQATHLGVTALQRDIWRYDYTIKNDSSRYINTIFIHFLSGYSDAVIVLPKSGWRPLFAHPISDYAMTTSNSAIAPGTTEGGFLVEFAWLGPATGPAEQVFDVWDAWPSKMVDNGITTPAPAPLPGPAPVPEPATFVLLSLGMVAVVMLKRRWVN